MGHARLRSVLLALGCLAAAPSAHGAAFTCSAGDAQCLIQAIRGANIAGGPTNTITLEPGTYSLTAVDTVEAEGKYGLPPVTSVLTIDVSGTTGMATIQRVDTATAFGVFRVAPSGHLTLRRLVVTTGLFSSGVQQGDAGLYNAGGIVSIERSVVTRNAVRGLFNAAGMMAIADSTLTDGRSGAIENRGSLLIARTELARNIASGIGCGAIASYSGDVQVADSRFVDNSAQFDSGAICVYAGTATITRSSFVRNQSQGAGGAWVGTPATLTVTKSAFSENLGNQLGAGIVNGGTVVVRDSTFANNRSNNIFFAGGNVISSQTGTVLVVNSTFAGNTVPAGRGGSVLRGPGITLQNSIIAHLPGEPLLGCSTFNSLGNNILSASDACSLPLQASDVVGDAQLAAFVDDGSAGNGHFNLLPASAGINTGNPAACDVTDQLGKYRTRGCDIGAVEFKPTYKATTNDGAIEFKPTDTATTNDVPEAPVSPSSR